MKNRRKYSEYWKMNIGYDFSEEYRIYRYLCGQRMIKKPEEKKRFVRKKAWEEYVCSKYKEKDKTLLGEFIGYLNLQKRNREAIQGINIEFYLPVMVAGITSFWLPEYFKFEDYFTGMEMSSPLKQDVLELICILIIFFGVFWLMFKGISTVWNQGDEIFFLEDYIKVVSKVIT